MDIAGSLLLKECVMAYKSSIDFIIKKLGSKVPKRPREAQKAPGSSASSCGHILNANVKCSLRLCGRGPGLDFRGSGPKGLGRGAGEQGTLYYREGFAFNKQPEGEGHTLL